MMRTREDWFFRTLLCLGGVLFFLIAAEVPWSWILCIIGWMVMLDIGDYIEFRRHWNKPPGVRLPENFSQARARLHGYTPRPLEDVATEPQDRFPTPPGCTFLPYFCTKERDDGVIVSGLMTRKGFVSDGSVEACLAREQEHKPVTISVTWHNPGIIIDTVDGVYGEYLVTMDGGFTLLRKMEKPSNG